MVTNPKAYYRKYRDAHREQIRENSNKYALSDKGKTRRKAWRKANHARLREHNRLYNIGRRRVVRQWWGKGGKAVFRKAEMIACRILEKVGFEVLKTSFHFPFDALARREGKIYGVEVTTYHVKSLNAGADHSDKGGLLAWLNWGYIVVFVRPTLEEYRILRYETGHQTARVWQGGLEEASNYLIPIPEDCKIPDGN